MLGAPDVAERPTGVSEDSGEDEAKEPVVEGVNADGAAGSSARPGRAPGRTAENVRAFVFGAAPASCSDGSALPPDHPSIDTEPADVGPLSLGATRR